MNDCEDCGAQLCSFCGDCSECGDCDCYEDDVRWGADELGEEEDDHAEDNG